MALLATRIRRLAAVAPWVPGTLLATVLASAYVLAALPSADLAAADYRSALFSRSGFSLWDNGWYAGHHLPGYSVLAPALGALLSPRLVAALAVVTATALFGGLAVRLVGHEGTRWASPLFGLCMTAQALAGRVPFTLGVAVGVAALVALAGERVAVAFSAALLTSLASPVAGFFLALVAGALVLAGLPLGARDLPAARDSLAGAFAVIVGAALPVLVLAVAFPGGGYEPFGFSDLWPELVGALAVALALGASSEGRRRRGWLVGTGLYALACLAAFVVHSPLGANVTRLGPLLGVPLMGGVLGPQRRWLAGVAAAVGLTWALATPVHDLTLVAGDPSVQAAYYRPLLSELNARRRGAAVRVEIPLTGAHWEAARVAEHVPLARGWERQLDTRYAHLFYAPGLTAAAYRSWLQSNAVAYVALPDVRLDYPARAEARLISTGLPYLEPVWRSAHWRLFAVRGAAPLVSSPGVLRQLGGDSFAFSAPRPGSYTVVVHFTPYWKLLAGHGCVTRAPGGWTRVAVRKAGEVRVGVGFSLARVLSHGARCR